MSLPKTVKTPKGTELPLLNLKGKAYLTGQYRLVWFNEENSNFTIETEFISLDDVSAVAKATVSILDKETGRIIKKATATKREDKQHFTDHTEKAESSAIFRALAMLGYGTQFSLELEEGPRIVDSPVGLKNVPSVPTTETETSPELANVQDPVKKTKWKPGKKETVVATQNDSW